MTTVRLPTRVRRTHLGCHVKERMTSTDGHLVHEITLTCRTPHIPEDVRKLELTPDNTGKSWRT